MRVSRFFLGLKAIGHLVLQMALQSEDFQMQNTRIVEENFPEHGYQCREKKQQQQKPIMVVYLC